MSEVVITGTGLISAAGNGAGSLLDAMLRGTELFRETVAGSSERTSALWPSAPVDWALAEWPEGDFWANNRKYANLSAQAAVAVALQAIEEVGRATDPLRCGCVMAISSSGSDELAAVISRVAVQSETDPTPLATLLYEEVPDYSYIRGIPSQMGQFVSMAVGAQGSNVAVYGETGAGGLSALALATRLIDSGELDRVVVVGVVPPATVSSLVTIEKDEPMASPNRPLRGPFDAERDGAAPGQGAVAIVLEQGEVARRRGAVVLAELAACETITARDCEEAFSAAGHLVIEAAGCKPQVWWAGGIGSMRLDAQECAALGKSVHAPVTTTKGTIGTAFEASALIDLVVAVEALQRGVIPPIGHLHTPDPALQAVDFVVGAARPMPEARHILVTACGVGACTTAGAAMLTRSQVRE